MHDRNHTRENSIGKGLITCADSEQHTELEWAHWRSDLIS